MLSTASNVGLAVWSKAIICLINIWKPVRVEMYAQERDAYPNSFILYRGETVIHAEFCFAVLEELTEFKQWCPLKEKFGNDTSDAEDVHCFGHSAIFLALNVLACSCKLRLLGTDLGIFTCSIESFRGDITSSTSRGVKVEGEIGRVIERKVSRFVGRKIGNINPVPGGDEDVLAFDVSVRDFAIASVTKSREDLECDPFLLDR